MKESRHTRRIKIVVLVLTLCVSFRVLGSEVMGYVRMTAPPTAPPVEANLAPVPPPAWAAGLTVPQMLQRINAAQNPLLLNIMNAQRAEINQAALLNAAVPLTPRDRTTMTLQFADELLKAGKTPQAIQEDQIAARQMQAHDPARWVRAKIPLLTQEAVGYLRLGEQQNCCAVNNAASCLVPISGPGVHTKQYGSRNAVRCLTQVLQDQPDDVSARWLLNIADMTLGEYPKSVPPQWLIPLKDFGGDRPMKKFYNAAPQMGLDLLGWAGSVVMEDFDGDGLLDLMVSSWNMKGQLRFFHNNGDGTFTERTQEAGLTGEIGGPQHGHHGLQR